MNYISFQVQQGSLGASMARKKKLEDVLDVVRKCADANRVQPSKHAEQRMAQRGVTLPEVLHVLRTGWHEKSKDTYNDRFDDWDYAIRSLTEDERDLRIAIAVEETPLVVVITVIDLDL